MIETSTFEEIVAEEKPVPDDAETLRERHRGLLNGVFEEFFEVDDPALLAKMEEGLEYVAVPAGEKLFDQGSASTGVYILLSGRLRAIHTDERGNVSILGDISRGETVGELGLVTEERRGACVAAVRESVLARLPKAAFETILLAHPPVALAMTRTIIHRFRQMASNRQGSRRPVNICVMPISDGLDLAAFVRQVATALPTDTGQVSLLTRNDFAESKRAMSGNRHKFLSWLREREAASGTVVMIAEGIDPEWTRACAAHADEIVLVADGRPDTDASVSHAETVAHHGETPYSAKTTLVLVHPAETSAPKWTSRWFEGRNLARHFHVRREGAGLRPADAARLARELSGRAKGLVLAGGGARGFAHVGVIDVLAEAGIHFDRIGGTSIGAVFGSFYAIDYDPAKIEETGHEAFVRSGGPTNDYNFLPMVSLVKGAKVRRITETSFDEQYTPDADIRDTWLPFFCVAANYFTGEQTVFETGYLPRAILASLSIPGALPPIAIDGQLYVDGGTVNNLPVDIMEARGANTIVAVDLTSDVKKSVDYDIMPSSVALLRDRLRGRANRKLRTPSLPEILLTSASLHSTHHQKTMRDHADLCIRPPLKGVRLLDWKRYADVVEQGREAARDALEGIDPELLERLRG